MSEMLEYSFGLLLKASITSEGDGIIVSKAIVNTLGKCAYLVDYLLEPESIKLPVVLLEQLFSLLIK